MASGDSHLPSNLQGCRYLTGCCCPFGLAIDDILQGSVIFPDKSKDDFPFFVLPLLRDLEEADTFSWGSKCAYTMSYVVQLATKLAPPYPPTNTCIASLTIIYLL